MDPLIVWSHVMSTLNQNYFGWVLVGAAGQVKRSWIELSIFFFTLSLGART